MAEITEIPKEDMRQSLLDDTDNPQLDHTENQRKRVHQSPSAKCYTICCQVAMIAYFILMIVGYRFFHEQYSDGDTTNSGTWTNALYFSIVTFTTIGYEDIVPKTAVTKVMNIVSIALGFVGLDYLINLANDDVDRLFPNQFRKTARLCVAFSLVCFYTGIGAVGVYITADHPSWLDSFYLIVVSSTSVGYGDLAFQTAGGRIFAVVWIIISTIVMAVFIYHHMHHHCKFES